MDDRERDALATLLEQALALPAEERPGFLEQACGTDAVLRAEVASLLAAFEASSGYFEELAERLPGLALAAGGNGDDDGDGPVGLGQTVAHYQILEWVGSGGMGVVYKARDRRLDRLVALKFLPAQLTADPTARRRLYAEARAAGSLDHPNIGVVHEIGETERGGLFIALAWHEGTTLKEKLRRGPLPIAETVAVATQIAAALGAAHGAGIVHRDVKASNIIVSGQGVAKLVDFGIAKVSGAEFTAEGHTPGTVSYMSPEQTRGEGVDARTDLWSLGVVLYEMLGGRRPFRGDDEQAVIYGIRHDEPEPIERLRPEVPAQLARVIETCLAKPPAERYQRAADLLADLRALDPDGGGEATRAARSRHPRRSPARRRWTVGTRLRAAAVMVGVAALAAIGYLSRSGSDRPELNSQRVAVTPFENRTGDATLDAVGSMAADWLIQGFAHTGLVDVVPVTAMLTATRFVTDAAAGAGPAERLRQLAHETGAGIVVSGAYYRQRDSLHLQATVTDAARGRVLYALEPIATPADLPLVAVEELRRRLMAVLASHLNPRLQQHVPRPGSLPPSFEAYRAHAEGLELFTASDWRGAIGRFAEAAAYDSTFLTPLLYSGLSFINLGHLAAVDSILEVARPHLHRIHEHDRLGFAYLEAAVRGDREETYRIHLRYPELAPGTLAHWGLANAALAVNRPRESVRVARQLDPDRGELRGFFLYWRELARAHHRLDEHREELRVAQLARTRFPDDARAAVLEVRALAALRRHRVLNGFLAEQLEAHPDRWWLLREAGIELLAHGSATAGRQLLREGLERLRTTPSEGPGYHFNLATLHGLAGDRDEAERLLRELATEGPERLEVQGALGTLAAQRGDLVEAARISIWLAGLNRPYLRGRNTYWRARIAAVSGEHEQAVDLLRQAFGEGLEYEESLHNEPDLEPLRSYAPFRELIRPKG